MYESHGLTKPLPCLLWCLFSSMSEGWADFAPGADTVAWSRAEVLAEAMLAVELNARLDDLAMLVLLAQEGERARAALAAWWKRRRGGRRSILRKGKQRADQGKI